MNYLDVEYANSARNIDDIGDIRELTLEEQEMIGAGSAMKGLGFFGITGGIGAASFGAGWGSVGVGLAFAVSPAAVFAMGAAALYGGYQLLSD